MYVICIIIIINIVKYLKHKTMKTIAELTTGTKIVYNDMANVDLEYVILDISSDEYGPFVNVMNLETRNIETMPITTRIDNNRWTIKN